jgi:hypothetical protein
MLKDQVQYLQAEGQRKDTIIMTLASRVPELEPASEPREGPQKDAKEQEEGVSAPGAQGPPEQERRRSWWREFFGLE